MNYHLYADDNQIYKFAQADNITEVITSTEVCVREVKEWMTINKLKLNDDKTETMLIRNPRGNPDIGDTCIQLDINGHKIIPSTKVKNLGVMLDNDMSMSSYVSALCKGVYFKLRQIGSVRQCLTSDVAKTLVSSMIMSKIDYCNSLLAGVSVDKIKKLQIAQNNAARLVLKKKKFDHATPMLMELHWLPVQQRIEYKTAVMCHKCIYGAAPTYLTELLEVYSPNRSLRSSNDKTVLKTPSKHYKSYGERSF